MKNSADAKIMKKSKDIIVFIYLGYAILHHQGGMIQVKKFMCMIAWVLAQNSVDTASYNGDMFVPHICMIRIRIF